MDATKSIAKPASVEKAAAAPLPDGMENRPGHLITVEKLLIHKYDDPAALLRKADKVCQELIKTELRESEGEYFKVVRPGRYHLHFPKLRADIGALRCSVLGDQLYRAIRDMNPAAQEMIAEQQPAKLPAKTSRFVVSPSSSSSPAASSSADKAEAAEMRKKASYAFAAMTRSGTALAEELINSSMGQLLRQELQLAHVPIWNVKTRLIVGYDCTPFRNGLPLLEADAMFVESGADPREARALIDIATYESACRILEKKAAHGVSGVIVCPVHASTFDTSKYVAAFLGSGARLADAARHSLVFLVQDFSFPISRIKVQEISGYLRSRCRSLLAQIPVETEKVTPFFKEFGFKGVRIDLAKSDCSEALLMKNFDAFVDKCERGGLNSAVTGLETQSLTLAALTAGFSYLAGSAIIRPPDKRGIVCAFDVDELFL